MLRRLALWMRARMDVGTFETKADISTFVLHTVLVATVMATAIYLTVAAVLAHFDLLPYPFAAALRFGGTTTILIASSVTALLAWLIGSAAHELAISRAEFERLSRTDMLSGLLNRRAFTEEMAAGGGGGSLALFDVDRLKAVNDRHGRAVGDAVIVAVSEELLRVFPPPHAVGRFGGEEFAVLVRSEDRDDCRLMVEEARRSVASHPVEWAEGTVFVTLSAGIADRAGRPLESVFEAADRALYLAKSVGRDRAVHEDETTELLAPRRRAAGGRGR